MCDSSYGVSIGRGSFKFARGEWTTVEQRVVLNTPGKQDGIFTLDVDGRRVVERHDVFYRDLPRKNKKKSKKKRPKKKPKPKKPDSDPDGDLGDILDPLLGGLFERDMLSENEKSAEQRRGRYRLQGENDEFWEFTSESKDTGEGQWELGIKPDAGTQVDIQAGDTDLGRPFKPVGFLGLFFSTFFGGHDAKYATPRDQYAWFKDFAVSNDT